MIDFEAARATMVDSQLRTDRVTDWRILTAFASLPRELFVPAGKRDLAYSDAALEVWPSLDAGPARFLLPPIVLARLAQLASVEAKDAVLDIGCATGYSTAILSHLARTVTAVEAEPELASAARETLQALGVSNAAVVDGDHARGAPEAGPFDVILLNGSVPEVPESLLAQLKDGGRLVAVVVTGPQGRPRQGKACLFVKVEGEASGLPHFDANAKPLPGFNFSPAFTF
jgi:protein-L-isoaspartate(D-aspartate) O-methyltransferase